MVNLFVSVYNEEDPIRKNELNTCLINNLNNRNIEKVYLIEEAGHGVTIDSHKICRLPVDHKPTFNDIFNLVNSVSGDNDINIIVNSDIYLDEFGVQYIGARLQPNTCFALTRWNIKYGTPVFMNTRDSQDVWCFRGKIKPINVPYTMGIPGCDNNLAHLLHEAGYHVTNPSKTIKSFHLHESMTRKWYGLPQIPPPYLLLDPHE